MLTGANDGRVNPLTPAIRGPAGGNCSGLPILLRSNANSGHGIGSALDVRIGEKADELIFLFDQLGMSLNSQ